MNPYDEYDYPALLAQAHAEIDSLRAELAAEREKQRWIPCNERLPEDNTEVLILSNVRSFIDQSKRTARIFTGSHNHKTWICDGDVIFHGSGTFYDYESVTHWRPLPAPPDVEEQPENTTIRITGNIPRGKPLTYFGDEEQQP